MSILGPADRRPELSLTGTTVAHLKTWRTEYLDEYSDIKLAAGVPEKRMEMAGITAHISTIGDRHTQIHKETMRLPTGHPPSSTYRAPGAAPIGTMTRGTGTVTKLGDSCLYDKEQTWAHWRVAVDGKPADTRRKYRGVS